MCVAGRFLILLFNVFGVPFSKSSTYLLIVISNKIYLVSVYLSKRGHIPDRIGKYISNIINPKIN